jgi:FkbM family methyltransferase
MLVLIPAREISRIWGIRPTSILHVGAHLAEELSEYAELNWAEEFGVIWIEAQEELIPKIERVISGAKGRVIQAAIWDVDDVCLELKITNNSQSTSLLKLGTHKNDYPLIEVDKSIKVRTKRLDSLLEENAKIEFLMLDIQGVELRALKSLGERIADVRWIYTEVNKQSVYEDCALISEMDAFLRERGFKRVGTFWVSGRGWGDALYIGDYAHLSFLYRWISSLKFFSWKFQQDISRVKSDRKQDVIRITSRCWNSIALNAKSNKPWN